jgi:hypothetical protein
MHSSLSREAVIARNRLFLRSLHSDSEEEVPLPASDLLPGDILFLQSLDSLAFKSEASLTRFTRLIHEKIERIACKTEVLETFRAAFGVFLQVYWRYLFSETKLGNLIADVFRAVLYHKERTKLPWLCSLSEESDLVRRLELIGLELEASAEEHQIEIQKQRGKRKRELGLRKRGEREGKDTLEVDFEEVFGPMLDFPQ